MAFWKLANLLAAIAAMQPKILKTKCCKKHVNFQYRDNPQPGMYAYAPDDPWPHIDTKLCIANVRVICQSVYVVLEYMHGIASTICHPTYPAVGRSYLPNDWSVKSVA